MKQLRILLVAFLVCMGLSMISCGKEDNTTPIVNDTTNNNDTIVPEQPSILGTWGLVCATQYTPYNTIDYTNIYGTDFTLIFEEDGTLITTNGTSTTNMAWELEGDKLGFIQAPGLDPVMYTINALTADSLAIEHGTGTDYVTVMELRRK